MIDSCQSHFKVHVLLIMISSQNWRELVEHSFQILYSIHTILEELLIRNIKESSNNNYWTIIIVHRFTSRNNDNYNSSHTDEVSTNNPTKYWDGMKWIRKITVGLGGTLMEAELMETNFPPSSSKWSMLSIPSLNVNFLEIVLFLIIL